MHVLGKQRRKNEQTPDAVNDRWHTSEQFNRRAERAAQAGRTRFGEEQGDAEADRNGDQQRDHRGHHRTVDGGERTKLVVRHIPDVGPEKGWAGLPQHGHRLHRQGNQHARQRDEHDEGEEQGELMKDRVLPLELPDLTRMEIDSYWHVKRYGRSQFAHGDHSCLVQAFSAGVFGGPRNFRTKSLEDPI
ncbi:hypothetical protein ACCAA_570034 [Candidatus Accumulibacter aalborgensis]|uniref:Uncharacterized protein n=1 Tax=Candidatus Accumulibacter aalborgensis TaxID=1860102 RepID=A0A1A8XUN0_9PROT|nr:hypothetical protein ACCAA_570034 [Candidatus Accumulibacter aalborgensis]